MKNSNVDISVIIPCYNDGRYLTFALQSIFEYKGKLSLEIIIVDDGSTEKYTLELLKSLEISNPTITIIHQKNQGLSAARNTGINFSKGTT